MARSHLGRIAIVAGMVLVGLGFAAPAQAWPTECPEGSVAMAKFNYEGGTYVAEFGGDVVTITDADADGGTWTSTQPVQWVVVKGGSGEFSTTVTQYTPPALTGTFSNEGLLNEGGNVPDISHVQFCGPEEPVETTTTTAPEDTTTTGPEETTTTAPEETTTTVGATTTTAGVEGTQVTQAPTGVATTEVLGVQLARTGFSTTMLVLGTTLLVLGLVAEILQRAALRRAS